MTQRNVILLGIVSFLNDLSSEMIMPILPLFITSVGGSSLAIGLIGGLREGISILLKVPAGIVSDKFGKRKPLVTLGYFISAVFKTLLAFSKSWQNILIFSSLERVGKGLRTAPRDAIIAESMPKQLGKGFGIHRAMDTLGAVFGTLLAFILFRYFGFNFKEIILLAGLISSFSLIPLYFVKETSGKGACKQLDFSLRKLPSDLRRRLMVIGMFAFANISYMFLILKAQQIFHGMEAVGAPILLYLLYNIFYAAFSAPFGKLSDKFGKKKILTLGYLSFSLVMLGFAFVTKIHLLIILFAFYGVTIAIIDANQRAFIAEQAKNAKATIFGIFHTVIGIIAILTNVLAGFLWNLSPTVVFMYASIISLIASLLLFFST